MKYECHGGPLDGGTEEAFSNISPGHVVNCRSIDYWHQYEYRADGRLHYIGTKPLPGPLDPELVDRLMEDAAEE